MKIILDNKIILMIKNYFYIKTKACNFTLVLAAIQLDVSESSSHFLIHFLNKLHFTGSCQFSPHTKQNTCKHRQITGLESIYWALITLLQSGEGHQRKSRLHCFRRKKCFNK